MNRSGNRGRLEGCPLLDDIIRKETRRRTNARRNRRYFLANVAFFDLMA
jgi:hypothetical protein